MSFDPNRVLYPAVPLAIIFGIPVIYFLTSWHTFVVTDLLIWAFCFFVFDNLGVQIGVHKHLCHRSFDTPLFWRRSLAFLSVLSGQGSPLVWVAVHMGSHHPHSDTEKDVHGPSKGLWFAFLAWYWRCDKSLINMGVAREYLRDKVLVSIHRHHTLILLGWWVLLFVVGKWNLLVFAGLLPAASSIVLAGFVNAFMHTRGSVSRVLFLKYQNHPGDSTYNSIWLGLLTMGLGLHNNHHKSPGAPFYQERWYEWDLSTFFIPVIRKKQEFPKL